MSNVLKSQGKIVSKLLIENQHVDVEHGNIWAMLIGPGVAIVARPDRGGATGRAPCMPLCVTPCSPFGATEVQK
jgi:hypothetical protein